MSTWGTEMDAAIALVRTVVSLPTGSLGAERGWRSLDKLEADELPHLFIFNPRTTSTALDFAQSEDTTSYLAELWADATQEVVAGYRDAIHAAIAADPTLGGVVRMFRMVSSGILEDTPRTGRRVLVMELQSSNVEG